MRNYLAVLFLFLNLVFLAACQPKLDIRPLSVDELAQVQVYGEPMADNLMATMQSRDYETFSNLSLSFTLFFSIFDLNL